MRYLKRLKIELDALTEKLGGQIFDAPPSKKANRARALQSLVVLIKQIRTADHATDNWTSESATEWFTYLSLLETWLGQAPQPPQPPQKVVEKKPVAA